MVQGATQQKANLFGFEPITQAGFYTIWRYAIDTHFVSEDELRKKWQNCKRGINL